MTLKQWIRRAGTKLPVRIWRHRRPLVVVTVVILAAGDASVLWSMSNRPEGLVSAALALLLLCNALGMFAVGVLVSETIKVRLSKHRPHLTIAKTANGGPLRVAVGPALPKPLGRGSASASTNTTNDLRAILRNAVSELPFRIAEPADDGSTAPVMGRAYPVPDFGSDDPCVTIVVPLFCEERFVGDTIISLKRQTVTNFEVVVVDDASEDLSATAALRAINGDRRFRLVRHLRNSGLSASRNTGLLLANAPYVTFLDADDMLLPDALEIRLRHFGQLTDERVAGVFCGVRQAPETVDADYRPLKRDYAGKVHTFISSEGECPFNAHAPILRTNVVLNIGGFDEAMRSGGEDWDLWQRLMRHGYWFEPVHRIAAVYRRKKGSMVRSMPLEHLNAGQRIFDWVHAPLSPQEIVPGTPFVFEEGLDAYRRQTRFLQRVVQYGAMMFMRDKAEFEQLLPRIPGHLWPYALKQFDVAQVVTSGLLRFLTVDEVEADGLGMDLIEARDAILAHYGAAAAKHQTLPEPEPAPARLEVTLFAANRKQASLMADLAERLSAAGRSHCLVSTEAVSGDQGVEDVWRGRGLPYASRNSYQLQLSRHVPEVKVVMRPYDRTIRHLASLGGGHIVEIFDRAAPVGLPDENPPIEPHLTVAGEDGFAAVNKLLDDSVASASKPYEALSDYRQIAIPFVLPSEERLDLPPDYDRLRAFKDRYRGERCFIIGNGPSLNTLDLTKLRNERTFAVNGIFYKQAEMGFAPTFYVVEDSSVMKENIDAIRAYDANHKFFPTIYRPFHQEGENVQFFLMNRGFYERDGGSFCVPRFSVDAARRVFCGQSVTHINLQLAYYFGFSKVYLIGMDFSYVVPRSAVVRGDLILSTEDDPNHFHPAYFGAGKTWKDPKLHRVRLNYEVARDVYAASGREIVNATRGGELEVFRRQSYDDLF